jgi:hypothetical protein
VNKLGSRINKPCVAEPAYTLPSVPTLMHLMALTVILELVVLKEENCFQFYE